MRLQCIGIMSLKGHKVTVMSLGNVFFADTESGKRVRLKTKTADMALEEAKQYLMG